MLNNGVKEGFYPLSTGCAAFGKNPSQPDAQHLVKTPLFGICKTNVKVINYF